VLDFEEVLGSSEVEKMDAGYVDAGRKIRSGEE
jgi:hypothetical protein